MPVHLSGKITFESGKLPISVHTRLNLTRKVLRRVINLDYYKDVREDFLQVYRAILELPEFKDVVDRVDPQVLKNQAIIEGEKATNYEPHKSLLNPLGIIDQLYWLIWVVLLFLLGVSTSVSWWTSEVILNLFNWYSIEIHTVVTGTPAMIFAAGLFYVYLLQRNTKFVQEMNRELRIPVRRINARGVDPQKVMAYKIWNRSLRKPRKLPVMCFLTFLSMVSPRIYEFVVDGLIWVFPKVFEQDTPLWRVCGRMFALVQTDKIEDVSVHYGPK